MGDSFPVQQFQEFSLSKILKEKNQTFFPVAADLADLRGPGCDAIQTAHGYLGQKLRVK